MKMLALLKYINQKNACYLLPKNEVVFSVLLYFHHFGKPEEVTKIPYTQKYL